MNDEGVAAGERRINFFRLLLKNLFPSISFNLPLNLIRVFFKVCMMENVHVSVNGACDVNENGY